MTKKNAQSSASTSQQQDIDTANENPMPENLKIRLREQIVLPNDYVALRRDLINEDRSEPRDIFMGQIGSVGVAVTLINEEKGFIVYFYDEIYEIENPEHCSPIIAPILRVDDLVKLHFMQQKNDPVYSDDVIESTISKGDTNLDKLQRDLDIISSAKNETLIEHELMEHCFEPGSLATIVYDFAIKEGDNKIIIFSGQVGVIKNILSNNYVCIVFRERHFKKLVNKKYNAKEVQNIAKLKRNEKWVIEAKIHKSFLLPLYYTQSKATQKGEEQIRGI